MDLLMFSKKLSEYDVDGVGRVVAGLGFDGVDLTVRDRGHVLPRDVVEKLPQAVESLGFHGLKVPMITTGITSAEQTWARETFETASRCGIRYLKLGYWQYRGFGSLSRQLTEVRENLRGIQSLASEHGIIAGLHIHSGDYMTATGGMVSRILEGMDADCVGAYIDPGHMVLEGGRSGWKLGMDLLRDVTVMVAVKDFGLERDPNTKKKWLLRHMPLSEGMVPWLEVLGYLRDISFDGPVSLHSEYEMPVQGVIAQTRRDLEYLRSAISEIWGRE